MYLFERCSTVLLVIGLIYVHEACGQQGRRFQQRQRSENEQDYSVFCGIDEYSCRSTPYICIPAARYQDGYMDCADGSDEICMKWQFDCGIRLPGSNACISHDKVGNGVIDCPNAADETCSMVHYECINRFGSVDMISTQEKDIHPDFTIHGSRQAFIAEGGRITINLPSPARVYHFSCQPSDEPIPFTYPPSESPTTTAQTPLNARVESKETTNPTTKEPTTSTRRVITTRQPPTTTERQTTTRERPTTTTTTTRPQTTRRQTPTTTTQRSTPTTTETPTTTTQRQTTARTRQTTTRRPDEILFTFTRRTPSSTTTQRQTTTRETQTTTTRRPTTKKKKVPTATLR